MWALFSRLINSSVFPENIDPQITSIHPPAPSLIFCSINMLEKYSDKQFVPLPRLIFL
jgi:hypothetical protein